MYAVVELTPLCADALGFAYERLTMEGKVYLTGAEKVAYHLKNNPVRVTVPEVIR